MDGVSSVGELGHVFPPGMPVSNSRPPCIPWWFCTEVARIIDEEMGDVWALWSPLPLPLELEVGVAIKELRLK